MKEAVQLIPSALLLCIHHDKLGIGYGFMSNA
ncbi:hypothetical protein J2S25_002277 [Mesobacillus stamsii]|uniref:Uncharacterized protein n=1 Tax=Mesobacillus stamsii TaxID=225347 RepID=A0ABU0FWF7_9BACI|nr:hypothetical protein [Mesobacillus stamsii]